MGNSFRASPFPAFYGDTRIPVTADKLDVGIAIAVSTVWLTFLIILPGFKGTLAKLFIFIRVTAALWLITIIALGNFAFEWQSGEIETRTQYKPFTVYELEHAKIGIKIGLRGINLTLSGPDDNPFGETIDYNERYLWQGPQGQIGFGVQAGRIGRDFRAAQLRGTPYPILWILEYFTLDGEQIRWGRKYRTSGWYTHIIMWLCLPLWALMCVLYLFNIRAASWLLVLIGFLMILGVVVWSANLYNFPIIAFPFENAVLYLHYGWTWYLTLFTGLFSLATGFIILITDFFFPNQTATFFGIETLVAEGILYQKPAEDDEDEDAPRTKTSGLRKTIRNLNSKTANNYRTTRIGTTRQKREGTAGDLPLEKLTTSS